MQYLKKHVMTAKPGAISAHAYAKQYGISLAVLARYWQKYIVGGNCIDPSKKNG